MNHLKRILIWILIFVVMIYCGVSLYIELLGKKQLQIYLNQALKRNVTISRLGYQFPLTLKAKNVVLEGLIQAQALYLKFDIRSIFSQELIFARVLVDQPFITYENKEAQVISSSGKNEQSDQSKDVISNNKSEKQKTEKAEDQVDSIKNKENKFQLHIKRLVMRDGKFRYMDLLPNRNFDFTLENIQLKSEELTFPFKPLKSNFAFKAILAENETPLEGSRVSGSGWVNLAQKDMQGQVEVVDQNNRAGLQADISSYHNDMEVKGRLNINEINIGGDTEDSSAVNELIFGTLKSIGVEIGAEFSFKTKMDDFKIRDIQFSGVVDTKKK